MDNQDEFYMVLPSNSSLQFYPDNATTCYTTHLSRELRLSGDWQVGIAEIHIPCTIKHVQEDEAFYLFQPTPSDFSGAKKCFFPQGEYESTTQLANEINQSNETYKHQMLEPVLNQKGYYSLTRKCSCKEAHITKYNEKIKKIFGFETDELKKYPLFVNSNEDRVIVGNRPAVISRAIPDQLFVYTDMCLPYTVGDTQASLLRIVSLDVSQYTFGSNFSRQFAPIHYLPLLQHNLQSITIDIRDQHGDPIAFEYGTLSTVLHFKCNRR